MIKQNEILYRLKLSYPVLEELVIQLNDNLGYHKGGYYFEFCRESDRLIISYTSNDSFFLDWHTFESKVIDAATTAALLMDNDSKSRKINQCAHNIIERFKKATKYHKKDHPKYPLSFDDLRSLKSGDAVEVAIRKTVKNQSHETKCAIVEAKILRGQSLYSVLGDKIDLFSIEAIRNQYSIQDEPKFSVYLDGGSGRGKKKLHLIPVERIIKKH